MSEAAIVSEYMREKLPPSNKSTNQRRIVYGHGLNDADYETSSGSGAEKLTCLAYRSWTGVLERVFSEKYHKKKPSYLGVSISNEWLSFMAFRAWWIDHHVDGWQIDKDMVSPGSRIYSAETCVYVPSWINQFVTDNARCRGEHPIGVTFDQGKFKAQCLSPVTRKNQHLGRYSTAEKAHSVWLDFKIKMALLAKPEMDLIDPRIFHGAMRIIRGHTSP